MTLLDAALIALVVLLALGVIAGVSRMLGDDDGEDHPDAPWPRWSSAERKPRSKKREKAP